MSETDWGQWVADTTTNAVTDRQEMNAVNESNGDNCLNTQLSSTTFDDLGEYELIRIFSYFPFKERIQFSWVCVKWRHCVQKSFKSESLFDMSSAGLNSELKVRLVCLLLQKCSNIRHINLIGVPLNSDENNFEETKSLMTTIVTNCSQLQSINLGALQVPTEVFKKNADYFGALKKITSTAMGEEALNCIISSENLETIDINRNDQISKLDFKRLGSKIRELHLNESEVWKPSVIKDVCEGNGTKIQVLSIDIKDKEVLSLICNNFKKLKELKLCLYSENCDFKGFIDLIDLKSLQIVAKDSIFKSEDFTDLIQSLKVTKISELRVYLSSMNNIAVADESLPTISKNCPFIEKLVINGANSLTGAAMYSIAQLKYLKHLNLKSCLNLTDQIDIVITSCPLLRELILHSCLHITNATVDPFIEKAKTFPDEKFFLDVIETNVLSESLPLYSEWPNNLKILYETDSCSYSSCEHGWGPDGYHSGPDEYDIDMGDFLENDDDYYDDYDDEDIDYEFS